MFSGNTSSSISTPPSLQQGGLKNWNSKENSNTAPQNSSNANSIPTPPPLPPEKNSNTAPQNSDNANPTAIPQATHPAQPPSVDYRDELKERLAKLNQEAADDGKQPEGQKAPTISPKPIVQKQQNQRVIATPPIVQKQQDTQSQPQQQQTEIGHSDKDKIATTQPTLENSSMPLSVLKVNISVPKLSIAICLLFTSNVSAIGCVVATAILYKAPVVPIVPIAIFAISMLVMFASIIYIVYSIKNALKVDIESNVPLAPEENLGNVVNPSEPTPSPIISSESGGESQLPPPSPSISNHSSSGAPPPPPPIANHLSGGASPSNGPSKPGNNMGNGDARGMMLSLIKSGVSLKKTKKGAELLGQTKSDEEKPTDVSLKKTEQGAELLVQTQSDEEKPNSGATLKSINKNTPVEKKAESNVGHELAQTLAKRRSVVSGNQGTELAMAST